MRVVDAASDVASQTYSLRVFAPAAAPTAKPAPAAAPTPAKQLSQLDLNQAGPPAHTAPTARVFQLEPAQLDALKAAVKTADPPTEPLLADVATLPPDSPPEANPPAAAPTPPPPAGLAWSDAQQAQLEALLKPVMAVEYPTQALFEAAVDAQVCAQAWQLIVHEAQRLKQQPPSETAFADVCAASAKPAAATTPKTAAKPASAASVTAPAPTPAPLSAAGVIPVGWRDLPGWLMPPGLRNWLVEAAARDRPLLPDKPLPWAATPSCNCAAPRPVTPLYAVYPTWLTDGPQPQTIDFSLVNRITYFALPLDNDQALDQAMTWTEAQTAFIRTARAYETRVDLGIYQADWRFLATEPAAVRDAQIDLQYSRASSLAPQPAAQRTR